MDKTLDIPNDLSTKGRQAAQTILDVMAKYGYGYTGGCRAFYSAREWRKRGEKHATHADLIVVYDGGDLAMFFESYESAPGLCTKMRAALGEIGVRVEPINGWSSAIYEVDA